MIGQTLAHYRIIAILGAGGMGEVYRARDTRLERDVALKLLPPAFAADPERRQRFQREARALAALDHPNIVTVHSVEEAGGLHFLTMGLIEGETLDRLIPPDGLPVGRLLELALPLTDALAAAHEKGVVHRDLKPGNVMVTPEGRLKILDFGLAKTVEKRTDPRPEETTPPRTSAGVLVGTMPYMSPEQAEALAVDARSDIFSLGVMLYEMAAGRRPFQGASAAALISSILRDAPTPLTDLRPELPGALGRLVARCLEKDRAHRYQTAGEVRSELESLRQAGAGGRGAAAAPAREEPAEPVASAASAARSVAVLPLVNHSANPDDEYFSDGITEEIINALTQIPGLRVAARTSSFAFKRRAADLRVVGETLRVRNVLEGSVRRAGSRLRITAQLVDVATGYHLWSERYDRELTDVFAIQDEIAAAIAAKLKVTLAGPDGKPAARRGTSNLEAYDLYLRGLALQNRRGRWIYQALECFEKAIALDPAYADPHAWMADSHRLLATYGLEPPAAAMPQARAAAERALGLDPTLAEAHATLADVAAQYDRDFSAAFRSWDRALEFQPGHTRARVERAAWGLLLVGSRPGEAIAEIRQAVDADPLNPWAASMLAMLLGLVERMDEASIAAQRALELDPNSFFTQWMSAQARIWAGDWDGAIAAAEPVLHMSGRHPWALAPVGVAHARAGRQEMAEAVYAELQARMRTEYVQIFWLVYVAAALGRIEEAMKWATRAIDERDALAMFMGWWPGLTSDLRKHPGFPALLDRLGLAPADGGAGRV